MRVLVTGGAGFIGSVVTDRLIDGGHEVDVLDNLVTGHREAVHEKAGFFDVDILNAEAVRAVFRSKTFDAVMHLAAESVVSKSAVDPGAFYRVNVVGGLNVLEAMVDTGVTRMVFSSTASVYGEPAEGVARESDRLIPVNAYGESKLAFERMLAWFERAHGIEHVSLRYFNACGATSRLGEYRVIETHLIPIAVKVARREQPTLQLFGTDYDTPDGTCLRDYVHVVDIADAHILVMQRLGSMKHRAYNIGNGHGFSNRDVIRAVKEITGSDFPVIESPRRAGDPAKLVADPSRIAKELGWKPQITSLSDMIASAVRWRESHPDGYN